MNRAILISFSLAAFVPVACGSSGGAEGSSSFSIPGTTQAPSASANDPLSNPGDPLNITALPPNPNQPPANTGQAPEPGITAPGSITDTCPSFCTGVSVQCAQVCGSACRELNAALTICPVEVGALLSCLGSSPANCSPDQKIEVPSSCGPALNALVPCIERQTTGRGNNQGSPPAAKLAPIDGGP